MKDDKPIIIDGIDVSDLPFFDPTWEGSSEMQQKAFDDVLREHENEKNSTIIYDPAEKKRRTYGYCNKKYGQVMADKMLLAKKETNGRLQPGDYAELMRKHNRGVESQSEKDGHSKSRNNHQFVPVSFHVLHNQKLRKVLKKSLLLYLYLRSSIVRKPFEGDKLDLYGKFYQKGKLASAISTRKLSRDLYMDEKTVSAYLRDLQQNNVLEIETMASEGAFDNQPHNVYIFGFLDDVKNEIYFIDEMSTNAR
jgi:hypothetical protein